MRTRGTPRWLATAVAGLAALLMALTFAGGPHRAASLLRAAPRGVVAATVHLSDASGLPPVHHAGKSAAHLATADGALIPSLVFSALLAFCVAARGRRRPRALVVRRGRSRAPPLGTNVPVLS